MTILQLFDLFGVAVFASSGALVASRKEMDLIGFGLMASLTGIGGGTVRDILLGRPIFWIATPDYIGVCLVVAVVVFFTAHIVQRRYPLVLWADAVGISVYAIMGAELALRSGANGLIAILMGTVSATFGGLARDITCGETPLILRKEVYATCAVLGATVYVVLKLSGVEFLWSALAGFIAGFGLRSAGIALGLTLPTYKNQPGRNYD